MIYLLLQPAFFRKVNAGREGHILSLQKNDPVTKYIQRERNYSKTNTGYLNIRIFENVR